MELLWATKDQHEREEDEAERLVRPAPKLKPPRRDRRRERTDADRDDDTQGDPDLKGDPDMSLNYKDVGAGEVPPQFQKKKKDYKGDGEEPKKKPPPFQKKDDKGDAPKDEKGDDEEAKEEDGDEEPKEEEEPSEGEEAGIKPPCRREASDEERFAAMAVLVDAVPKGVAGTVEHLGLHPDDMHDLVLAYKAAQTKNPTTFSETASQFFEVDPDRVKPPLSWKVEGKAVPFETLEPADQEEAYRKHQMQVVGMSLAALHQLTLRLTVPGLREQPRIPPKFAARLAMVMLSSPTGKKLRDMQVEATQDEEAKTKLAEKTAALSQAGEEVFRDTIASGEHTVVNKATARSLLRCVQRNDVAARMAKGFLMANDYTTAKRKFLSRRVDSSDEAISELDSPQEILQGLERAASWFRDRAKAYDEKHHEGSRLFQNRVLERLKALVPDKYQVVRAALGKVEAREYKSAYAAWKKEHTAWEKRREAWEREAEKHGPAAPYRMDPFTEPEPEEPPKPLFQAANLPPAKAKELASSILKDIAVRLKASSPPEPETSDKSTGQERISTCTGSQAMDHKSDRAPKVGVYHGVDPLTNDPGPYEGWTQVHQRDLGELDFQTIVSAAQEWLREPVVARMQTIRDAKMRAALDLALKSTGYDRELPIQFYNMLLARLAGVPEPGPGQTLTRLAQGETTSNQTSPCAPTPNEVNHMTASHEIRKMAAKVVASNPNLAFELTDLADRVAMEEKATPKAASEDTRYAQLKSQVIRTAHADAEAKRTLLPILQTIKALG